MGNEYFRLDDINGIMKNNRIAIYGTGFVAMKFYDVLVKRGLGKEIECFIVSKKESGQNEIRKMKICSIDEFENKDGLIICVAVHEVSRDEIEKILDSKKIKNYIWIYPYLYDLALGSPLKRGVPVPVKKIVRQCHNYRIAIRYLAVENYFGKNSYGYDIYRKAQEISCGKISAEKRLESFCRLIQNWENDGYNNDSRILISEDFALIDGIHRTTLARYFKLEEVACDIYKNTGYYAAWMGSGALLARDKVLEAGFTKEEMEIIEDAYIRVKEDGW